MKENNGKLQDTHLEIGKDLIFVKWDAESTLLHLPLNFASAHSFLLVYKGSVSVEINQKHYELNAGDFADFLDEGNLCIVSQSENLEGYLLCMNDACNNTLFKDNPPFSLSYPMIVLQHPLFHLSDPLMNQAVFYMENISRILTSPDHLFYMVMLRCEILQFVMEIANSRIKDWNIHLIPETKRKRDIFLTFCELLSENVSTHRSIEYYANELCISSQYLSRIVKEISGKTVYYWISSTLLKKVLFLMKSTPMSIAQIADELNFSDQSALNKFFKRCTGISPSLYKKEHNCI